MLVFYWVVFFLGGWIWAALAGLAFARLALGWVGFHCVGFLLGCLLLWSRLALGFGFLPSWLWAGLVLTQVGCWLFAGLAWPGLIYGQSWLLAGLAFHWVDFWPDWHFSGWLLTGLLNLEAGLILGPGGFGLAFGGPDFMPGWL